MWRRFIPKFSNNSVPALAVAASIAWPFEDSHALGIAAVAGDKDAQIYLIHALRTISLEKPTQEAGITTISPSSNKLVTTKFGSTRGSDESRHWLPATFEPLEVLETNAKTAGRHCGHTCGIASARDPVKVVNNDHHRPMKEEKYFLQPQMDSKGRIALVHEGQLANALELRRELQRMAMMEFKGNTDSELIVELIGWYMDKGNNVADATKEALSRLDGSYAVAVIDRTKQDEVIVAQNGSSLAVGIGDGKMYVASDPIIFSQFTNRYISLKDGEFAIVRSNDSTLDLSRTEQLPLNKRTMGDSMLKPASPFEHWTLSEIYEQPDSISRSLGKGCRISEVDDTVVLGGFDKNAEKMLGIRNLTFVAQGSSYFSVKFAEQLMAELQSFDSVQCVESQEMTKRHVSKESGGVCVVSKSGETSVSQRAAKLAKKSGFPSFSIVNAIGSQVAKITKAGAYLNAGQERGNTSTKVFTSEVTVLALVAAWFSQYREGSPLVSRLGLIEALRNLPESFTTSLKSHALCKKVASKIGNAQHCFVVGKSFGAPVAGEGALLLNMLANVNAEGMTPDALKHGAMSLIDGPGGKYGRTPVIMIIISSENPEMMRHTAELVRASGAYTIVITDDERYAEGVADVAIPIPRNGILTSLNAIVPLQLLAFELGLLKGINPDEQVCVSDFLELHKSS